jgi:hypothetical protein
VKLPDKLPALGNAVYTWDARELPILRHIHGLEESLARPIMFADLASSSELDADTLQRGLKALHEGGYVTGIRMSGHSEYRIYYLQNIGLTTAARRAVGQWPSDSLERLVEVLNQRLNATDDPDEKSRLERLRDAIVDAGSAITVDVLKAWAIHLAGPR